MNLIMTNIEKSWEVITKKSVSKTIDKSIFDKSTGTVSLIYDFFNIQNLSNDTFFNVQINEDMHTIFVNKIVSNDDSERIRFHWGNELDSAIKKFFPDWVNRKAFDGLSHMKMIFIKTDTPNIFKLQLLNLLSKFKVNKLYIRANLHDCFGGSRYSSISACISHDSPILIFTNPKTGQDVYKDKFLNGSFYYSGEGRIGNMQWTKGNLAIRDHKINHREIHLFESDGFGGAKYIDRLELSDINYYQNFDDNGNQRTAFQFILNPLSQDFRKISYKTSDTKSSTIENQISNKDIENEDIVFIKKILEKIKNNSQG